MLSRYLLMTSRLYFVGTSKKLREYFWKLPLTPQYLFAGSFAGSWCLHSVNWNYSSELLLRSEVGRGMRCENPRHVLPLVTDFWLNFFQCRTFHTGFCVCLLCDAYNNWLTHFILFFWGERNIHFLKKFIVIQLQLCAFSPHSSTPPQPNPPPSPLPPSPLILSMCPL